jgi:undecaprenyl-diphosphatase
MNALNTFELGILDFIQEHLGCAFLDAAMPIITMLGDGGIFWISIAVIMLFFKSTRKTALTMGMALVMGLLVCNVTLKPLVGRIRPYDVNPDFPLLIDRLSDYSFPSGHTVASFEAAVTLMICERRRFGYAALALAFVIAFSRLYLYVHYPTDVLTSIILGSLFAVISYFTVSAIYKKFAKQSTCEIKE